MHMHMSSQDHVADFHVAFGVGVGEPISVERLKLRHKLIAEEYLETVEAIDDLIAEIKRMEAHPDRPNFVDQTNLRALVGNVRKELTDLRYVIDGTYVLFGWNGEVDTKLVHNNNMAKLGPDGKPVYRKDGKVMKPEGFEKLDPATLVTDDVQYDMGDPPSKPHKGDIIEWKRCKIDGTDDTVIAGFQVNGITTNFLVTSRVLSIYWTTGEIETMNSRYRLVGGEAKVV